jgi:hypothetical protein
LKELREELAPALCALSNKSLSEGEIPGDWKRAVVTPLHKKGEKNSVKNNRPVSLTSIPCKIMESIVRDQLMTHLLDNGSK